MVKQYQHTQVGYLIIVVMIAAIVSIGLSLANAGTNRVAVAVLIILVAVLILFSSLTVSIMDNTLEVRFGPGIIRKRFNLRDIESCQAVKNSWYFGWGIRLTPYGWLYNVSGFQAVEIKLRRGSKFRIGTDVPQELESAIREALDS
jgi:hypothetical protein